MKLVIAEYLRTLRERDELDRLLPDLLVEMNYVSVARPQTGNRQFGVDLAARGKNPADGVDELMLLVIKQGDIGRTEWDSVPQGVRSSINEVFDVYLRSHLEPQDQTRRKRIVFATNGELKQTVQASWSGYVTDRQSMAIIEFWGIDKLAELVERYLLDEHLFRDQERKLLRRALALSGDSEYDQSDLHKLFIHTLGLKRDGGLHDVVMSQKELLKALRIVNLSAQVFAAWSATDGDARQALRAVERAMLWSWHRLLLADQATRSAALPDAFSALWIGYLRIGMNYFHKLQAHCYTEDGLSGYHAEACELSLVAFEQIGILATIGLASVGIYSQHPTAGESHFKNAQIVADALAYLIQNNGICNSPCLDRHSQDINLALILLVSVGMLDEAKNWLDKLVRNLDFVYKTKKYIPIATDSLDDLAEGGGWDGSTAGDKMMDSSWILPTMAGWCAVLSMEKHYHVLAQESNDCFAQVCMQLWHPDETLYQHLYFKPAHIDSGLTEAPIHLPQRMAEWQAHMEMIKAADKVKLARESVAAQAGMAMLDVIACRHFSTPISPSFWYQIDAILREMFSNKLRGASLK